jgi:hypothetical protein
VPKSCQTFLLLLLLTLTVTQCVFYGNATSLGVQRICYNLVCLDPEIFEEAVVFCLVALDCHFLLSLNLLMTSLCLKLF